MNRTQYLAVAIAAALMGFSVHATAQEGEAAQATEPAAEASTEVNGDATGQAGEEAAEKAADAKDPMGWFGIGLKLGLGGIGGSDIDVNGTKIAMDGRTGFQLAVPINLGGDGFGWMFEPYMNLDSDVTATGLYTGPNFNIHIMDPLYVGFGFGLKFASLSGDNVDFGVDVGGRLPVTATYYILEDIGVIGELGLGYTGSGYKGKANAFDPDPEINFGYAFAWDFSVGVRWP